MNFLAWLRRVAGTSLAIVLHPSALGRWSLLRTYFRISLKEKFLVEICKRRITEERIFSQTIHFTEYTTFMILFEEVYVTGVYYFQASHPAPLVIDAGANIGLSAAYFKTIYPTCRILAFEADSRNFALLERNAERNAWTGVEMHNLALHATDGELPFYDYNNMAGSLSGGFWQLPNAGPPKNVTRMRTVPLSRYIDGRVDLLKMDVEGSERPILEDLSAQGKLAQVDQMILEYHHHVQVNEDALGDFLALLEKSGFGYHLRAPLALPFPQGEPQNFMMNAYRKRP
jgi:FkbM family methyltransferase